VTIDMSKYIQDLQNLLQGLNNDPMFRDLLRIKLTQGEITDVEYTETTTQQPPEVMGVSDVHAGSSSTSDTVA
jgi:hypothetical protein